MTTVDVRIKQLEHGAGMPLPAYKTADAAGCDLAAAVPADAPMVVPPGGRALVPTGIAIALPPGFEGQVRPRSGLSIEHGVTVINAPGTIDADYRGEVQVPIAERPKAAVLKTVDAQASVGSNPTSSAIFILLRFK